MAKHASGIVGAREGAVAIDGRTYDYCIVGSGAAGMTVAAVLLSQGASVLMLEEGSAEESGGDYLSSQANRERAYVSDENGRLRLGGDPWTARTLGGGVRYFAGISFRYRAVDFAAGAYLRGADLDPDWPFGYETLRPYYDRVESLVGVARAHGADPTEPPSARPPLPPHDYPDSSRALVEAGLALGMVPFPTPVAINSRPWQDRQACLRRTPCTERPCPVGAKFDTYGHLLPTLRSSPDFRLRTGAKAVRVLQSRPDRVWGVEWLDLATRWRRTSRGRVVILAANAVQSAALLLRSANTFHAQGLANGRGLVGAGLSFKASAYVTGALPGKRTPPREGNGPHSTVAFMDHYEHAACPTGLGGVIYDARPAHPRRVARETVLRLHCLLGDHPMRSNRVRLANRRNTIGLEYLHIDYRVHPVDRRRLAYLTARACDILRSAGCERVNVVPSGFERGSSHLHGTCRAGRSPADSVVDPDGRVHDIDNLYVVDGGFMPFAGGVNPTLTIQANGVRIADSLLRAG
jgi:paromamine 6'-oxidase/6'''-hydroxyneomycin C oxidase/2'-deamino-2'-hydroxyparomamine 6'-oxidase